MANIKIVKNTDSEYSKLLKKIKRPPELLYCLGDTVLFNSPCIAVVGTRKPTEYGKWCTYNIVKSLVMRGHTIVSGMASGIDEMAHRTALELGGKTIAVMGTGIDGCYPARNKALKRRIEQDGLVISEDGENVKPRRYSFPIRNRIIAGLSEATIVVQAGVYSGSLITAQLAMEEGRQVYAVPGDIDKVMSIGCNKLIADGAIIITVPDDVAFLEKTNGDNEVVIDLESLSEVERKIYELVKREGEMSFEKIARLTKTGVSKVMSVITEMEIKGLITTSLGRVFIP